uniref:Uncharacterized protein n=1 Tax=Rhizophora mucronata TaxID=61149 RepID=A0A2P2NTX1_RHIMU
MTPQRSIVGINKSQIGELNHQGCASLTAS